MRGKIFKKSDTIFRLTLYQVTSADVTLDNTVTIDSSDNSEEGEIIKYQVFSLTQNILKYYIFPTLPLKVVKMLSWVAKPVKCQYFDTIYFGKGQNIPTGSDVVLNNQTRAIETQKHIERFRWANENQIFSLCLFGNVGIEEILLAGGECLTKWRRSTKCVWFLSCPTSRMRRFI